jgi:hypothetical protein
MKGWPSPGPVAYASDALLPSWIESPRSDCAVRTDTRTQRPVTTRDFTLAAERLVGEMMHGSVRQTSYVPRRADALGVQLSSHGRGWAMRVDTIWCREALADAQAAIRIRPKWPKAYTRRAAAHHLQVGSTSSLPCAPARRVREGLIDKRVKGGLGLGS